MGAQSAVAMCEGQDLSQNMDPVLEQRMAELLAGVPYADGRLFEVSRDGRSSILFGTIHLSDPVVATPPQPLLDRLAQADGLVIEVTADEERRMVTALSDAPGRILAPEGASLREALGPGDWGMLTETLRPYGFSPEMADVVAPWFLTIMLAVPPCAMRQVASGEVILDRQIEATALTNGTAVTGLEEFDTLFDLFASMSYERQVDILRVTLPSAAKAEDFLATTRAMYLRGEIQAIRAFSTALVERDTPEARLIDAVETFYAALLTTRNILWMDTLLPALNEGNRVVAVGALHLGGTDGVLALLEAEGFTITRLDAS